MGSRVIHTGRKETSAVLGSHGQKVASERSRWSDDGTIANRRGYLNVDDEGIRRGGGTSIENGRSLPSAYAGR